MTRSDSDSRTNGRAQAPTSAKSQWRTVRPVPRELANRFTGLGDFPRAVSAGRDVFVFGGHAQRPVGLGVALYRSDNDSWSVLPRAPVPQRANVIALWTGRELVVWGGTVTGLTVTGAGGERDGAAYSPETNEWRRIADAPFAGGDTAAAVWTGSEMIVWGGGPDGGTRGAAYSPSSDSWRPIADAPLAPRLYPTAVWTGRRMIVWGSCALNAPSSCDFYSGSDPTDGAVYDPETDSWQPLSSSPLPPRPRPHSVWTGKEMVIWGGHVGPATAGQVGAAYNPVTDSWRLLPAAPLVSLRDFSMLWSGKEVLVLGGQVAGAGGSGSFCNAYDPDTDTWRTLPSPPYADRSQSGYAWTDAGLFALGRPLGDWWAAILSE